jgi:hypothetical protein
MQDEPQDPRTTHEADESLRGGGALQQAAEVSVILAPIVAPVAAELAHKVLNRPPKEQGPQEILPPGVDPE